LCNTLKINTVLALLFVISMMVSPFYIMILTNTSDFNAPIFDVIIFPLKYAILAVLSLYGVLTFLPKKGHLMYSSCSRMEA